MLAVLASYAVLLVSDIKTARCSLLKDALVGLELEPWLEVLLLKLEFEEFEFHGGRQGLD